MSLRPLRKKCAGLSEALIVNWLIGGFTAWGAVVLYAAVNLHPAIDLTRMFLGGIGFILSALTIYLPRQVEATFSLPARYETSFKVLATLSIVSTISILFFTSKISLWPIVVPVLSLTTAVVYSQIEHWKNRDLAESSLLTKWISFIFPTLCIAIGLGEGLFFGDSVVTRGVTISLPLIYLSASLMLLLSSKNVLPSRLAVEGSDLNCPPTLTPKEFEIASAVYQGLSNKQIADQLNVSPSTVKNHLYSVFKKLSVTNRVALIKRLQEPQA